MPYYDMLDNPVAVGDTVVYPAAQGSSAAAMKTAVVTEIIDIHYQSPQDRRGRTRTSTKLDEADRQLFQRRTNNYTMSTPVVVGGRTYGPYKRYEEEVDPGRAYLLRVKRVAESDDQDSKPRPGIMLKNVDRVVVVTSLLKSDV